MKKTLLNLTASLMIGSTCFAQNLVTNGNFELPDDGNKHYFITERTGWYSDDETRDHNGNEHSTNMSGNYYWFCNTSAGSIYQPIDKITSDSAIYKVSYLYGTVWNANAGNDTLYSVIYFSHYTPGTSIKNRQLIDSIAIDVTTAPWDTLIKASFKLPANLSYTGDSLVIEFATRVVDKDALSNVSWAGADSITVFKNDSKEFIWKEFEVATKIDTTHISSKADFSILGKIAWDSTYIYLNLDVTDDFIYAPDKSYMNDNFEIYFDMNNGKIPSSKRGEPIWPTSYNGLPGYFQLRLIPAVPFDSVNTSAKGFAIQEYEQTSTGYKYELKFSIDSLFKGYKAEIGKEIGFDILASDNDTLANSNEPYYRDQLSYYSPSATIWCDAVMWGTLKFANNGSFDAVYDETSPTKVTNLVATKDVKNILLTWDAATDNVIVEKYVIFIDDKIDTIIYAQSADNSFLVKDGALGKHTFGVAALDIAGNQSSIITSVLYNPVGIQSNSLSLLTIYPNPAVEFISLNNQNAVRMEVFNTSGQIVIVKSVNAGEKVDVSALNNGVYSLRIIDNNNVSVLKLVKK